MTPLLSPLAALGSGDAHNLIGVVAPITAVVAAGLPTILGLFEGSGCGRGSWPGSAWGWWPSL